MGCSCLWFYNPLILQNSLVMAGHLFDLKYLYPAFIASASKGGIQEHYEIQT